MPAKKSKLSNSKPYTKLHKVIAAMAITFFVIWIILGLIFLLFMYGNYKQGAFKYLFSDPPEQVQTQGPVETDIPGVGTVNIECVQTALPQEAIQKLVAEGQAALTEEENAAFEPCLISEELSGEGRE